MPTTSQLWFITKKAAIVIGVLAIAHAVAAPRSCGGCAVKSSPSQAAANPALGGPDTKTFKATKKTTKTGETNAAGGGAWSPGTAQRYGTGVLNPGTNPSIDASRISTPGAIGGGAVRAR